MTKTNSISKLPAVVPANLYRHLQHLTVAIGPRLAGSQAEREAADYLAQEAGKVPGVRVAIEDFPVWERAVTTETLEVEIDGVWHAFACSLFGSAPSTDGHSIEAPLVFFDSQTGYLRDDLSFLRGAAVVHLGCHIETPDYYRRLIAAEPAFLLFVDVRHPGAVALADGLFPAYVQQFGARTTVNVAYQDAWRWKRGQATRARLCVLGERRKSLSQNVIVEVPGSDPDGGILYVGGHHDTQAGTPGADDNAVGSSSVLELARVLAGRGCKRSFCLISFGAEEQLSVGSANYVRRHRQEVTDRGRFMFNIDGSGSALGWLSVNYNGRPEQEQLLRDIFKRHGFVYDLQQDVFPYTDQFPFAVAGVPGLWLTRKNCTTGVFYHHRHDDTLANIDTASLAAQLDAAAEFLAVLADADTLPPTGLPAALQQEITSVWDKLYGGWQGWD